ncbi:MAG: DUF87 domain-containing protein, partial [Candidatus Aenigmatarchaeota archaeon]
SFSPPFIDRINLTDTAMVNVSVSVPKQYMTGKYNGTIQVNAENFSMTVPLYVIVPMNISWSQSPLEISKMVLGDTNGIFGEIELQNTGNAPVFLEILTFGNISSYIFLDESEITLPIGQSYSIKINYTAPAINEESNFTGEIVIRNTTADQQKQTFVSLYVLPYYVNITKPTEVEPIVNITFGDVITSYVNVTYSETITENVTFYLRIGNESFSQALVVDSSQFLPDMQLWEVNFTAPLLPENRAYDLNVTAYYSTKNVTRSDIEYRAINYRDSIPPNITLITPLKVPAGYIAIIDALIYEEGNLKNVSGIITYPDNRTEYVNFARLKRINNTYYYQHNITNTTLLGVYTINATSCDFSNNCANASAEFSIYPAALFHGYSKDYEAASEPIQFVNFSLYQPGTQLLLFNITPNMQTGYYSALIDARSYDVQASIFNSTILARDVEILQDVFNPMIFGDIPSEKISLGALTGLYVETVLNTSNTSIRIDYSSYINKEICKMNNDCRPALFFEEHLSLFRCNVWMRKVGCSSGWSRLNTNINTTLHFAEAEVAGNISGAYALAPYICGDGVCDHGYGESPFTCPRDCELPRPIPAPPAAGGGGGGGGGGGAAGGREVSISVPGLPYSIKSTLLFITIKPGEQEIHSIEISNNEDKEIEGQLKVEGFAWEMIMLEEPVFRVAPKTTKVIKVKVFALPTTQPGIYTADLVTTINGEQHRTPITIKVEYAPEPLLDVKIEALSKSVRPGEEAKFQVTVINMGQTATIEDIILNYTLRNLRTNEMISVGQETIAVEDVNTFIKSFHIPEDTPTDRYVIEVTASYWYGKKQARAAAAFDVVYLPAPLIILKALATSWITYLVVLIIAPTAAIGYRAYRYYATMKKIKAKYIFPVDIKKLPQPGPNTILVGKIAETDINAYTDVNKLVMHSLAAGGTGSGKTVSAMVTAEELLKRDIPVIVFDPTAQWTGFIRPCKDEEMFKLYPQFGLKREDARGFKTNIIIVKDPNMKLNLKEYMKPGEITVFVMNKLSMAEIDTIIRASIQEIFDMNLPESKQLKLLMVYDEVHRLLPKYGGKGGFVALERGAREFRKWGVGLYMISQVLMDFRGAIRANIGTEIQLRTKYEGDINRVKTKYGADYAARITKLTTGTGLVQNPEYNDGKPWFVTFRPLLHDTHRLTDEELAEYDATQQKIKEAEDRIAKLKARKIDTYDVELELNIAKDKMKQGMFKMAQTYLESVDSRLKALEKR